MSEAKKESQDGSCCSSGSSDCCGCKKFVIGLILGLLVAAAAFGFYSAGMCAGKGKMCPMGQM